MKDIRIASVLLRKRKEMGITQNELAQYIGVSKASVSKWETGASFPDIGFLPQLATYFDISIDDLLAYNPQMAKEDIRSLRLRLSDTIDKRPVTETLEEVRCIIKKYYSCYPLLMQMGLFLYNNVVPAISNALQREVLQELIDLFARVCQKCEEVARARLALQMESLCYLALGEPDTSLDLLRDLTDEVSMPPELLVASAQQMKGNTAAAKQNIQVGLYQNLAIQMNYFCSYLMLVLDDTDAFEATIARAESCMCAFALEELHPCLYLTFEITKAMGLAQRGETSRCLTVLEHYASTLARARGTLDLHGDTYFDLIDPWIAELETGSELPRSNAMVESELIKVVLEHPLFVASLADEARYKNLASKLERLKEND